MGNRSANVKRNQRLQDKAQVPKTNVAAAQMSDKVRRNAVQAHDDFQQKSATASKKRKNASVIPVAETVHSSDETSEPCPKKHKLGSSEPVLKNAASKGAKPKAKVKPSKRRKGDKRSLKPLIFGSEEYNRFLDREVSHIKRRYDLYKLMYPTEGRLNKAQAYSAIHSIGRLHVYYDGAEELYRDVQTRIIEYITPDCTDSELATFRSRILLHHYRKENTALVYSK
jgi:hypothetical protein